MTSTNELTALAERSFAPARRVCACGTKRVDATDFFEGRFLHGLFHCFLLPRRAKASEAAR